METKLQPWIVPSEGIALPQLAKFNSKIFYLRNQMPHRTVLLKLVAQQEQNLHSLYDYQVKGDGSLTESIVGLYLRQ